MSIARFARIVVGHSDAVLGHSALGFDADPVVSGGPNALLAAEESLGRLI
jgi:hypothetical protein